MALLKMEIKRAQTPVVIAMRKQGCYNETAGALCGK